MKIIFAGTPVFAVAALRALQQSTHHIAAVYTQPDRQKGRGLKVTASPVKEFALHKSLPVYQPLTLREAAVQEQLASWQADVMIVAAYGMLLPAAVLAIPRYGCINIHPSLLPRFRGAAPIQRTIYAGDKVSGVTIMQMDAGLDTGPILLQRQYTLAADETSQTLHDVMAELGATCLLETLDLLSQNKLIPTPQNNEFATYAPKITKEEAQLNWHESALHLEHKIRAFNPWPVAHTAWQGQTLRIWLAKAVTSTTHALPGTLLAVSNDSIDVATASGVLRLLQLQLPGGKVLSAADFYHARQHLLLPGQLFS